MSATSARFVDFGTDRGSGHGIVCVCVRVYAKEWEREKTKFHLERNAGFVVRNTTWHVDCWQTGPWSEPSVHQGRCCPALPEWLDHSQCTILQLWPSWLCSLGVHPGWGHMHVFVWWLYIPDQGAAVGKHQQQGQCVLEHGQCTTRWLQPFRGEIKWPF